jgi:hypothetical protein
VNILALKFRSLIRSWTVSGRRSTFPDPVVSKLPSKTSVCVVWDSLRKYSRCSSGKPSPSRRPSFLQNAVLTTEYPTYANPANIAEHKATLFTVLSPADVAMLTLVADHTEYLAATRTTSRWHTSPLIINYYLCFHYKNAARMSLNLRNYRFVNTLHTATSHNLAE